MKKKYTCLIHSVLTIHTHLLLAGFLFLFFFLNELRKFGEIYENLFISRLSDIKNLRNSKQKKMGKKEKKVTVSLKMFPSLNLKFL